MKSTLVVVGAIVLAAGSAAMAEPSATPTADASSNEKPAAEKKLVCRFSEVTASRIGGRKVCRSREEWKETDRQTEERLQQANEGRR